MKKRYVIGLILLLCLCLIPTSVMAVCNATTTPIDWVITTTEVCSNLKLNISGNISIASGGSLFLNNTQLVMNTTYDGHRNITVLSGGLLNVNGSNITSYNSSLEFVIHIYGKANITNSTLSELGWTWNDNLTTTGLTVWSSGNTFTNNVINNSYTAIGLFNSSNNTISNNIFGNGIVNDVILIFPELGTTIDNSKYNVVSGNTFYGTSVYTSGIRGIIDQGGYTQILNNIFINVSGTSIELDGLGGYADNNSISNLSYIGIMIDGYYRTANSSTGRFYVVSNNTIDRGCNSSGDQVGDLYVWGYNNTFKNNYIRVGQCFYGILERSQNNTYINTTIVNYTNYGMLTYGGINLNISNITFRLSTSGDAKGLALMGISNAIITDISIDQSATDYATYLFANTTGNETPANITIRGGYINVSNSDSLYIAKGENIIIENLNITKGNVEFYHSNNSFFRNSTITFAIANNNGVHLYNSTNITLANLSISNMLSYGIYLENSYNSSIINCTLNDTLIRLDHSYYNSVYNNYVFSPIYAIRVLNVTGNNIYNNIFNYTGSVPVNYSVSDATTSYWNTTNQSGSRIVSSIFSNNIGGNYWVNLSNKGYSHTCGDADHDGFCDIPYTITDYIKDWLPLALDISGPSPESVGSVNSTFHNQNTTAQMTWSDKDGVSFFIFSSNNSGTWANSTAIATSGTVAISNYTFQINKTNGQVVGYKFFINDSSNIWNVSDTFNFTTNNSIPVGVITRICLNFNISVCQGYANWTVPTTQDNLTGNGTSYDRDGDNVTFNYWWTKNGVPTSTDNNISNSSLADGDLWVLSLSPYDGINQGWSVSSDGVYINTATNQPNITSVQVTTNLTATVNNYSQPTLTPTPIKFNVIFNDSTVSGFSMHICKTQSFNLTTDQCGSGEYCKNATNNTAFNLSCLYTPDGSESFNNTGYAYIKDNVTATTASTVFPIFFYYVHARNLTIPNPGTYAINQTYLLNASTYSYEPAYDTAQNFTCYKNGVFEVTQSSNVSIPIVFDAADENLTNTITCYVSNKWGFNSSNVSINLTAIWHPPVIVLTSPANGTSSGLYVDTAVNFYMNITGWNISRYWIQLPSIETPVYSISGTLPSVYYNLIETVQGQRNYFICANNSANLTTCNYYLFTFTASSGGGSTGGSGGGGGPGGSKAASCLNHICEVGEDKACPVLDLFTDCNGICEYDPSDPFSDQVGSPDCPTTTTGGTQPIKVTPRTIDPILGDIPAPFQAIGSVCRTYNVENIGNVAGSVDVSVEGKEYTLSTGLPANSADWITVSTTGPVSLLIGEQKSFQICVNYPAGEVSEYEATIVVKSTGYADNIAVKIRPPLATQVTKFMKQPVVIITMGILLIVAAVMVIMIASRPRGRFR